MPVQREQQDELTIIVKGQKGEPGEGGDSIPDNVEIDMDPDEMEDILDGMTDNHSKGQEQADEKEMPDDISDSDIDANGKGVGEEIKAGADKAEGKAEDQDDKESKGRQTKGEAYKGGNAKLDAGKVGYKEAQPTFSWRALLAKFITTSNPPKEETYSKPSRSSASGAIVAAAMGGAAVKPGEKPGDTYKTAKIGFIIDASGRSNMSIVMATAVKLLQVPAFKNVSVGVIKYCFCGQTSMHKVVMAQDKAAEVKNFIDEPKKWPEKASQVVFGGHIGGSHTGMGTNFSHVLTTAANQMLSKGCNVIIFPDSDIMSSQNFTNFMNFVKGHPKQIFIIFDCEATYKQFKTKVGSASANITYFK